MWAVTVPRAGAPDGILLLAFQVGRSSPAATPTPSPTPTSAADGTRLAACEDGTCEVKVSGPVRIPVAGPKFKIGSLRVTSVEGDAVTLRITARASGSFTWACDGDRRCFTSMVGATEYAPAMGRITGHPGAKITANKIMVGVVSAASGTAILRLAPA